jgi:vancomycin permeability regulator SanA
LTYINLKYFVFIGLLWFVVHILLTVAYGLIDTQGKAGIAVILGNTVNADSTLSPQLKARLEKGFQLYKKNQVTKLLVSGGTGKEGVNEATEMELYYLNKGILSTSILVDSTGNNTLLTAQHTAEISKNNNITSVIIVSQYYHLMRCKLLFDKQGINTLGTASPIFFEWRDFYALFREFFGYYYYLIF